MNKSIEKSKKRISVFVREYVKDFNGARAAIAAGYSKNGAKVRSSVLLTKGNVQAMVKEALDKRNEKVELTAEWIIRQLMLVAGTDLKKAFDEEGRLLPIHEMPDDVAKTISSIEVETDTAKYKNAEDGEEGNISVGVTTKIKRYDKVRALELLGRHKGIFKDKLELTGKGGGPVVVKTVNYKDAKI